MKKENKNLWRRYEKNRPIIPNRQKQKRKSDRRKLHPQTKKKYRVYFFHSRGLKRIPHTRPQLHWRVLLLRAAMLCCEYTTYQRFPFRFFPTMDRLWTPSPMFFDRTLLQFLYRDREGSRPYAAALNLKLKKACFAVEKNTSKSIKSYFWWVDSAKI